MRQFQEDTFPAAGGGRAWLVPAILPVCLFATLWILRQDAGPFWQWNLLDPSYFYLFDALNLVNGDPPGHVAHPGVPVYTLGYLSLKLLHLGADAGSITDAVLADPEAYLRLVSNLIIVLNAVGLWLLGWAALSGFGNWSAALAVQAAPFMSSLVVKHGFLPKPEGMLVFAVCVFLAVTVTALRPGRLEGGATALAVLFGIAAGFGVAIKITAVPIYVLPLVLLANWRAIGVYAVAAALSFVVFTLPAIGVYQEFAGWVGGVVLGSGAHGTGAQDVVDLGLYPERAVKLLKRPALKVPLIAAAITLAAVWWRRRRGGAASAVEVRGLIAVSLAQIAHVLVVAKHPAAFYMIPSYMLGALSVVLASRIVWALRPPALWPRLKGTLVGAVALGVFVAAQAGGLLKLDRELRQVRTVAHSLDNAKFAVCTRIFIYSASSPVFALYLADRTTGHRFSARLKRLHGGADYWIDDWVTPLNGTLRDWDGPRDFAALAADSKCLFLRGHRSGGLARYMERTAPGLAYRTNCSVPPEMVLTVGVDCDGRVRP